MNDLEQWLELHGLGKYREVFAENDVGFDVLPHLTEEHLKELGVSLGDRLRLLKALGTLDAPGANGAQPPAEQTAASVAPSGEAERRQLTVMFCDLVGSTALSSKLDPEDMSEVISSFQNACRIAIESYGGFIARYMGDGILIYFGFPQAHEDDAERAVRAGLGVVDAMTELNAGIGKRHAAVLAVRIGVATGPVVVGDIVGEGAAEEAAVVGETPNLAARLQGVAGPDQVVVARATHKLLESSFEYEDLGTHVLKGIEEPEPVWRALRERDIHSRYEARRKGSGTPLVGRQEELGLLLRSWETSKQGHGQAILIQGEAGIGKSRLIEALRDQISGDDYVWVAHRCSPYHANSTLYPVIEHLKRALGWSAESSAEEKLEKLEATLADQSLPLSEVIPLYAELLVTAAAGRALPTVEPQSPPEERGNPRCPGGMAAGDGREYAGAERVGGPALGGPDDAGTVGTLSGAIPDSFDDEPPHLSRRLRTHVGHTLAHDPANPQSTRASGSRGAGRDTVHRRKASPRGSGRAHRRQRPMACPLYVEELTKTILESEFLREQEDRYTLLSGELSEISIPATLQDSLMARLDRLPTLREVAQMGAVLGREFAYEMLRAVVGARRGRSCKAGLEQLVADELLYQRGRVPRSKYIFKHALIQDAAYQSLLRRTRQQCHKRVARAARRAIPRNRGEPSGARGASLRRGSRSAARHRVLEKSRRARTRTVGQSRSDCLFHRGHPNIAADCRTARSGHNRNSRCSSHSGTRTSSRKAMDRSVRRRPIRGPRP